MSDIRDDKRTNEPAEELEALWEQFKVQQQLLREAEPWDAPDILNKLLDLANQDPSGMLHMELMKPQSSLADELESLRVKKPAVTWVKEYREETNLTSRQDPSGPKLVPSGGIPVAEIKIRNRDIGQLANALKSFEQSSNAICYLHRFKDDFPWLHMNEPDYWIISLFDGDDASYRELRQKMLDKKNMELWLQMFNQLEKQTLDIGYVEVVNLPIMPIIFNVAPKHAIHADEIRKLAEMVKKKLGEVGFEVITTQEKDDHVDQVTKERTGDLQTGVIPETPSDTNTSTPPAKAAIPAKGKQGSRNYSVNEKIAALEAWERLDRDLNPITVDEWLVEYFGEEGGVSKVPRSTFYGWKKLLKK